MSLGNLQHSPHPENLYNCHHVLKQLLPDQYNLRHRRHTLSLSVKHDDRNFVTRQLFKDAYLYIFITVYCSQLQFVNCFYSFNE